MPEYLALTYTADVNWFAPEQAEDLAQYRAFAKDDADVIEASVVLYPTSAATVVRVVGARGGEAVLSDGPYAETKEALTGHYVITAPDLDGAVAIAARIPAAWGGAVEVRPILARR
jgi:hypothetical protein